METKSVLKQGDSLTLALTKHLRKIECEAKDEVFLKKVMAESNKFCILVSRSKDIPNDKFLRINREVWNQFYDLAKKHYKGGPTKALNDLFSDFIKKYSSMWTRPIFKI